MSALRFFIFWVFFQCKFWGFSSQHSGNTAEDDISCCTVVRGLNKLPGSTVVLSCAALHIGQSCKSVLEDIYSSRDIVQASRQVALTMILASRQYFIDPICFSGNTYTVS